MTKLLLILSLIVSLISCTAPPESEKENSAEAAEEAIPELPVEEPPVQTKEPELVEPIHLLYSIEKVESNDLGYIFVNYTSPDGKVVIDTEEFEPASFWLKITRGGKEHTIPDLDVSPSEVRWSKDSRFVALNNEDYYAGSGAMSITIVDVTTNKYMDISCDEFVGDTEVGARSSFSITDMSWNAHRLSFDVGVNYLGSSGHPGIDENRKSELGDHFEKDDPVTLGTFIIDVDQALY